MNDFDLGLPVKIAANADFGYTKSVNRLEIDSEVFPPCYNRTKQVGKLKPRTFHIKCDGKGHMDFREMLTTDERMKRLNEWKKNGWIEDEEYKKKRKEILDDL